MIHIAFILLLVLIFVLRKSFSRYYFTPTGFLCVTWITFIFLMQIFAQDFYFTFESSFYIFLFIFFFFLGESFNNLIDRNRSYKNNKLKITPDFKRKFELCLKIMGVMSLFGALLYLLKFASYFGGIKQLFTAGWAIRGALVSGEINVPFYVKLFLLPAYSNTILALLYYIIFPKIRWYLFFPFIALFIMGSVQAGRAGFMLILFQVYISVLFGIYYKNYINKEIVRSEIAIIKKSFFLVFVVLIVFVGGDMLRTQNFSFDISSVNVFKSYLFGGISAFNTFLTERDLSEIQYGLGKYSFSALYDILGISKNEMGVYTNYLRISKTDYTLTTNIFTAFRQYIDDFGILGTCVLMFFFGMICNFYYNRAVNGSIKSIGLCIVLYTFLFHTTLLSISVHNSILLSLFLPNLLINLFSSKTKV